MHVSSTRSLEHPQLVPMSDRSQTLPRRCGSLLIGVHGSMSTLFLLHETFGTAYAKLISGRHVANMPNRQLLDTSTCCSDVVAPWAGTAVLTDAGIIAPAMLGAQINIHAAAGHATSSPAHKQTPNSPWASLLTQMTVMRIALCQAT